MATYIEALTKLGIDNLGMLYVVDKTGFIVSGIENGKDNARKFREFAESSCTMFSGTFGSARINVTAVSAPGNFTSLTIAGVAQTSGAVAATPGDPEQSLIDLATAINAHVPGSGPNYIAEAVGELLILYTGEATDAYNGDAIILTAGASITFTADSEISGGASGTSVYAPYGFDFYINPDPAATEYDLTGATYVTPFIMNKDMGSPAFVSSGVALSSEKIQLERWTRAVQATVLSTAPTENFSEIVMEGVQPGDEVILNGVSAATGITVLDKSVSANPTANLYLQNAADYVSQSAKQTIKFVWRNDATTGYAFYETHRADQNTITVDDLRNNDIPTPVSGAQNAAAVAGGATFTLIPGTDKEFVALTGTATITNNNNFAFGGSPIAGDHFIISGLGSAITYGGGSIIVNGVTVTEERALSGQWTALNWYNGSAWKTIIFGEESGTQYITNSQIKDATIDLGAKGVPASITAGMYGANSIDGSTDILAGSISSTELDPALTAMLGGIYLLKATIPTASVLTLNATPILLVAAPGAGYAIEPITASGRLVYNSIAYTTNFTLEIFTDTSSYATLENTELLKSNAGTTIQAFYRSATPPALNVSDYIENKGLYIQIATGNAAAGDSDLDIYLVYRIISL